MHSVAWHGVAWRRSRVVVMLVGALLLSLGTSWASVGATPAAAATVAGVAPNPVNELDCNGLSPKYSPVRPDFGGLCVDPLWVNPSGHASRFYDNGRYIGHDEPSVKFISHAPHSANDFSYVMKLSTDPTAAPTVSKGAHNVTDYAELSPAPWFGLPICDPRSYPQNPCVPDSNVNQSQINNPAAAGSAFMELQFYPPGYPPFIDAPSCSSTKWCAALTIDSLECTYGFASCNPNCIEPINFAFLQRNGVPAGPPSPQLADVNTFTANAQTLEMNPGDVLKVAVKDTKAGLRTTVADLTTGQKGFIVASAHNGFMDTKISSCAGVPFSFHAEYNTAAKRNQVPWSALEGGVLMEDEIGHFEVCSTATHRIGYSLTASNGQSFNDPKVYQTCGGGNEPAVGGEGPCNLSTGACVGSTTETGVACPVTDFLSGLNCEYSDALCMRAGSRTIQVNGSPQTVSWPVTSCQQDYFQNGDLDYDGASYLADWPNGSPRHPTSFQYIGPFTKGKPYPKVQFETDAPASEIFCNTTTGVGCTVPPLKAAFYPFWTLGKATISAPTKGGPTTAGPQLAHKIGCAWNFGNTIAGVTVRSFGKDGEYGTPDTARYGGTSTSPVMPNPQLARSCIAHKNAAHHKG